MPLFEYKARTRTGEVRNGSVNTTSEEAALDLLQRSDLVVVSIKEVSEKAPIISIRGSKVKFSFSFGVKTRDVVVFTRQLSVLFEAQIPVIESLRTLIEETSSEGLKSAAAHIAEDVQGGLALSQAMGKHSSIFSDFYVNLVHSGEESGKLREIFTYLADYLERSYYIRTKAFNAMLYPAFILLAFMGVLTVLMVVVIPQLAQIFEDIQGTPPVYTRVIIGASLFLREWGFILLFGIIGGGSFLWRWTKTGQGTYFIDKLKLSLPIFGNLFQKMYMTQLTDNLRTLAVSGIPILRALTITRGVVQNVVYQNAIDEAIESVKAGGTISSAFARVPEIPPLVTQMIKTGETSGRLDFILESITKFYSKEVESLIDNLITLIEPLLILVLGGAVGGLVAAIMIPLYNLVGSL